MAGRKRIPDHLKLVAGTARPDRTNPNPPVTPSALPEPPEWLSTRAAEIFLGLVGVLEEMGIASISDTAALALLSSRLEEVEICTAIVEDGGRSYQSSGRRNKKGQIISQQVKRHPAVGMRSEAMRHAQSLLAEFGLTPAARSKVSANKAPESNPFKALLDN